MKNSIIYTKSTLKMVERIDGSTTTKSFKTLEDMMEDKNAIEEYLHDDGSDIKVILK